MANGAGKNDFIVRLDGLKLDEAAKARLAGRIQGAVLREIAGIDTGGDLYAFVPHKEWIGLWVRMHAAMQKQLGGGQIAAPVLQAIERPER